MLALTFTVNFEYYEFLTLEPRNRMNTIMQRRSLKLKKQLMQLKAWTNSGLPGFEPLPLWYPWSALTSWSSKPTGSLSLNWFVHVIYCRLHLSMYTSGKNDVLTGCKHYMFFPNLLKFRIGGFCQLDLFSVDKIFFARIFMR